VGLTPRAGSTPAFGTRKKIKGSRVWLRLPKVLSNRESVPDEKPPTGQRKGGLNFFMQVLRLNPAPTTWQEALEEFILRKQAEGASQRTLDDYHKHVTRFFAKYPTCWPDKLKVAVYEYMAKPKSPAYFNLCLIYLRASSNTASKKGTLAPTHWQASSGIFCRTLLTDVPCKCYRIAMHGHAMAWRFGLGWGSGVLLSPKNRTGLPQAGRPLFIKEGPLAFNPGCDYVELLSPGY